MTETFYVMLIFMPVVQNSPAHLEHCNRSLRKEEESETRKKSQMRSRMADRAKQREETKGKGRKQKTMRKWMMERSEVHCGW